MNRFVPLCLAALSAVVASAPARADFSSCVGSLKAEAARAGISSATIDQAFNGLKPDQKVLDLQQVQPEFKTPIWDYVDGLVDEERVADGKAAMAREARALAHAEQTYGVSRYMLAAIWGVESNFGTEMGSRPLVQSLSTLACLGERASYFRSELMAALKIIDRGDIPAGKLAGSWAGAFGQTQFMPSSYLRLAAPGMDGGRDIVDSADDALSSTAHYFVKGGWRSGVPWGFEVKLPAGYSGPSGRKARQPMSVWAGRGITRIDGRPLGGESEAGLLLPAGKDGPAFLVTRNFDVVYSYNAAESYSLAACILADRLAGGPGIQTPWPTDDPGLSRVERRELQALLVRRGYDVGNPDGAIGAKTKQAIADFQGKVGLPVNGRASVKVLQALRQ